MESPDETLDRISRRRGAVFAMDAGNRIIHWNRACETLFGLSARQVMGKPCYKVIGGRDANGNDYCQQSCPAANQVREPKAQPVCPFELNVRSGDGERTTISTGLFAIPSYHPAVATLVHVCQEAAKPMAAKTRRPSSEDLEARSHDGRSQTLTPRETEVLQGLGIGLTVASMAATLFISEVTVRNHVSHILVKLHCHSKLAAVVFAQKHQLI